MKKALLFTMVVLLFTACCTKPSFDTSLLPGKWLTTQEEWEDGMMLSTNLTLDFLNESEVEFEAKISVEGEYLGKVEGEGTYSVSGDRIKFNFPESNMEISLNRGLFESNSEYNQAVREAEDEMKKEFTSFGEDKVVSISEEKLVLEENRELIQFTKKN